MDLRDVMEDDKDPAAGHQCDGQGQIVPGLFLVQHGVAKEVHGHPGHPDEH